MKTFGKLMLTFLYWFMAGVEMYCVRRWLKESDRIWEESDN